MFIQNKVSKIQLSAKQCSDVTGISLMKNTALTTDFYWEYPENTL